jgi:orotate phosphoribosyltransferase
MPSLSQQAALELCREHEALYSGHFIGTQGALKGLGRHMPEYVDSRTLITYPKVIGRLAVGIADLLRPYNIRTVVGMPLGAFTLGSAVADVLDVRYAMAEKTPDGLVVARSAFVEVVAGQPVAVVEDTVQDGTTLNAGIEAVENCGGEVVAVGVLFNRGTLTAQKLGKPLLALINKPMHSVTREECMENGQCSRGEPINRRPGHGHDLEKLIQDGIVENDPRYSFV